LIPPFILVRWALDSGFRRSVMCCRSPRYISRHF
jgi:hypothetical protein